jgi:CubicO group peptidase (beta-lactamase class C family)
MEGFGMRNVRLGLVVAGFTLLSACTDSDGESPLAHVDAFVPVVTQMDAAVSMPDAPVADAPATDTPVVDAATADANVPDAMVPDATPPDTAPLPEIVLLKSELNAIVTKPSMELSSLAVLALHNGEVSYEGHFGNSHIDNANPAMNVAADQNSLYRIASISKMVTAIGAMQLVEEGKLDLDADASTYLGFQLRNPNFPNKVITTRMILSHKSSIRDGDSYSFPANQSLESVFTPTGTNYNANHWAAVNVASSRAPGDYFSYENINFGVLATIMETASGKRFDKLMHDKVLAPLGITGGYYPADFASNVIPHIATLYRKKDSNGDWNPAGPWVVQQDDYSTTPPSVVAGLDTYVLGKNGTLFGPQGSLRITVADMGKLMKMFLNAGTYNGVQVLKPASITAMQANEWTYNEAAKNGDNYFGLFLSWGLGTQRFIDSDGGDRLIQGGGFKGFGHLGEAYGLLSGFIYDPVSKDGLIYLIGGLGDDPDNHFGDYSVFYKWEEQILTALHKRAVAHNATP